jgi:hypothetical protein
MKRSYLAAAVILLGGLVGGPGISIAAETGTKTMPDSSVHPPRYRPIYNYWHVRRHECALPSGRCGNNHRIENWSSRKLSPRNPKKAPRKLWRDPRFLEIVGLKAAAAFLLSYLPDARLRRVRLARLERDGFKLNRHRALDHWWSMIFSENRFPLFRIML